jgi:hypothetical protein
VIEGRCFEVPDRYRHLTRVEIRYASWDLAYVHLVDERTGMVLCRLYPLDKQANASGLRRARDLLSREPPTAPPEAGMAPLAPPQLGLDGCEHDGTSRRQGARTTKIAAPRMPRTQAHQKA